MQRQFRGPFLRVSLLVLFLTLASPSAHAQIFVKWDATGANDGTSWTDAYLDLQSALATASNGDEIWVAAGTYKPTSGSDRTIAFDLVNGVALFGGFAGTETLLSERDIAANITILSGDIGVPNDSLDNSCHVVTATAVDSSTVIDGFFVEGGQGTSPCDGNGVGMSIVSADPVVRNIVFRLNNAVRGAGVYSSGGDPLVTGCIFEDNTAALGGGMFSGFVSNPTVTNCVFDGNMASSQGGAMYNGFDAAPTITNVTFYNNAAIVGGTMSNEQNGNPVITNCISWGDSSQVFTNIRNTNSTAVISYSLVQGSGGSASWDPAFGTDAGFNIDTDPLFVDAPNGDLQLTMESPAVNVASGAAPSLPATDIVGNPRVMGGRPDMGAYEFPVACPPGTVVFVNIAATGTGDGSSWTDAFTELGDALVAYLLCVTVREVWVAAGTYMPTTGSDRDATFLMRDSLAIYGGFAGGETMLDQRDVFANPTILSGDIGVPSDSTDNSHHVVTSIGNNATAVLDGFVITAGNADSVGTGSGGGLIASGSRPSLSNLTFVRNSAWFGGGLATTGSGVPDLRNVTFDSNSAISAGGGIFGEVTLLNSSFTGNAAGTSGGGMYSVSGANIDSTSFTNNSVTLFQGGGLYLTGGGSINASTFTGNTAPSGSGGGLYIGSAASDLTFIGNSALNGGGMYNFAAGIISDLTFQNNSATDNGGGFYSASSGVTTVTSSVFEGNTATNQGGAVHAPIGTLKLHYSVLTGNSASDGGALHLANSGPEVVNCLIVGNTAGNGGAIFDISNGSDLISTTISDNTASASGGGLYNASANSRLINMILWQNSAPIGPEIAGTALADISFSLVDGSGGSGAGWDPTIGNDGGYNIDADPLFVDAPGGDFHVPLASPVVDAGDNTAVIAFPQDLDGNSRVSVFFVDLGCYEVPNTPPSIVYVDDDGNGNGSSWANAANDLRWAITTLSLGVEEVWVAEGTYWPTTLPASRELTFSVPNGGRLYGGFAGVESSIAERDISAHPTFLSGENGNPSTSNNAYHVVTLNFVDSTTVIDGFIITKGFADGGFGFRLGGGMTVGLASPQIRNCVFVDNYAVSGGGGIWITNSSPTIVNCVFIENTSVVGAGARFDNAMTISPTLTNVTFANNVATTAGGGIWAGGDVVGGTLTNVILWGNTAPSHPQSFGGPLVFSHSLVQGSGGSGGGWSPNLGVDGGNNIDANPLFVDAPNGDVRLGSGSPAIDAGSDGAPSLPAEDLDGNPRIIGVHVDMGAYENTDILTGIDGKEDGPLPKRTALVGTYPNPFNPTVTVAIELDRPRHVRVSIYDVRGKRVRRLIDEPQPAGKYRFVWDATGDDGQSLASGVYFIRVTSEGWTDRRKVVLLK